jgi:hypothetical protein
MAKKNKPLNASIARVRVAPKKRSGSAKKRAAKAGPRTKRAASKEPPRKLFDAKKWFGAFPELAGPTLKIQRQLRDEW